jgi:hypothetical protein
MPGALLYPAAIASIVLLVRGRSRVSVADWALALVLTLMAVWAERGVAWWAMGMVYLLGGVLAVVATPARAERASRVNGAIAVMLGVLIIVALPWWRPLDPLTGRTGLLSYAPSGLAAALRDQVGPGTRAVVTQTWGSWFEWAVPEALYLVDSRFELFPAPVWADYMTIQTGGDAAPPTLERLSTELVVMPPSWIPPAGWKRIYEDADGVVYGRDSGQP